MPGAVVQLKPKGDFYTTPVLAQATVEETIGRFHILSPPVGEFMLYAIAPSAEYWDWFGVPVTIPESRRVDVGTLYLSKKMELLSPARNSTIDTRTPTLRWRSFPDSVRYHVDVHDEVTGQGVFSKDVVSPTVEATVEVPLAAGRQYQWRVTAYNALGHQIAYYSAWLFTVAQSASTVPAPSSALGLLSGPPPKQ